MLMDLRAIRAAGAEGVAAVAAITVQGPRGVRAVHPVSEKILVAQIETLVDELSIGAVKIGALGSARNVRAVSAFLHAHPQLPVVLDPVIKPTHGVDLMPRNALIEMRRDLLDIATVVTPNRYEAGVLAEMVVSDANTMRKAGKKLQSIMGNGNHWVLLKGGHLAGDPVDMLLGPGISRTYRGKRRPGEYRGTGCALASAIAAGLALGLDVPESVTRARRLLLKWIDQAVPRQEPRHLRP
jgi:hydroxymethylpyrimidine/phosphomethylpyrimidine kinase